MMEVKKKMAKEEKEKEMEKCRKKKDNSARKSIIGVPAVFFTIITDLHKCTRETLGCPAGDHCSVPFQTRFNFSILQFLR